jgi:hypothetical protein
LEIFDLFGWWIRGGFGKLKWEILGSAEGGDLGEDGDMMGAIKHY